MKALKVKKHNHYDYLLSYSRDIYSEIALPLVNKIEEFGFRVWIDKTEVELGVDIYLNIFEIIESSKNWNGTIVIIDSTYFKKEWCKMEFDYIVENNFTILPIFYKTTKTDFIDEYPILKKLDHITIDSIEELELAINKILYTYIKRLQPVVEGKLNKSPMLNILLSNYIETSKSSIIAILSCYNVSAYIKNYLIINGYPISNNMRILFLIIEIKMKELVLFNRNDRFNIKIVDSAILYLIDTFSLNS